MDNFKYIIFDIDGVLAKAINPADEILRENNITMEKFFENWVASKAVSAFETGSITPTEFSKARGKELDLGLGANSVLNILTARKSVLYDGVEQLLDNLYTKNIKVACLSNTNIVHWNNIEGKEVFDRYFFVKFLSYEMGLIKPQKEIYLSVLHNLHCKAHEIMYFDDSKKNIGVALSLGFNATHVKDFYDLSEKIDKLFSVKLI